MLRFPLATLQTAFYQFYKNNCLNTSKQFKQLNNNTEEIKRKKKH